MRTLEEIEPKIVGAALMCEECGTVLSVFDDECGYCGKETGFGVDAYYVGMRDEIEEIFNRQTIKEKNR